MNSAIVLILSAPVPALNAEAGDRVVIRPGHKHPIVLQRDLPTDAGATIAALDTGELKVLTLHTLREALAALRALCPLALDLDAALARLFSTTLPTEPNGADLTRERDRYRDGYEIWDGWNPEGEDWKRGNGSN